MENKSRRQLLTLAFSLIVVMLGYGMVIPIIPFYIEEMGAGGVELGLLVAAYAFTRLIFGPVWGTISDRVGRRPVLMIGVFGYALAMFFFGLATELWMLFVARVLSGVLSSATGPTTLAYISDSTSEEERGGGMGTLGAAVGLGTILGPALGGLLSGYSLAMPFFVAAGLSVVSVVLIYLILPESLDPAERATATWKLTDALGLPVLKHAMKSPVGVLLILAALVVTGMTVFYGIFGLYALERFDAGPEDVGVMLMVLGLVSAFAQGALSGPLTKRLGDAMVIKITLAISVGAYLLMIPADTFPGLLVSMGFFILITALMIPALSSLTSKVTPLEQGLTMGLSNSFMSLGRILGPLLGGFVFDMNLVYPFVCGAAILLVGFGLSFWGLQGERMKKSEPARAGKDQFSTQSGL